jgi:hypothetical protein
MSLDEKLRHGGQIRLPPVLVGPLVGHHTSGSLPFAIRLEQVLTLEPGAIAGCAENRPCHILK